MCVYSTYVHTLCIRYSLHDDHLGLSINYASNAPSPYLTPRGKNMKGENYVRIAPHDSNIATTHTYIVGCYKCTSIYVLACTQAHKHIRMYKCS